MKINNILHVRFKPNRITFFATGLGILSIFFSLMLNIYPTDLGHWIFRIIFQISIVGLIIPLYLLSNNNDLKMAGLRYDKKYIYILISIGIAGLLLFQFWTEDNELFSKFNSQSIEPAAYIAVANIYEVIFFVVFLRYYFEKAFGILPAIILSALFYSFHHAGFQPEFIKLFFVGLTFISIFRVANHWLICFPFWWIGGIVDVLTKAEDLSDISGLDWEKCVFTVIVIIVSILYFQYSNRSRTATNIVNKQ